MATLNIKNVPEGLYSRLKSHARRQRRSVSREVIQILEHVLAGASRLSVMDLRGLGKDVWKKVEPTRHVKRERDAWD